ncbi:MAG: methionine adenosyltransferase, partial [Muribaculaceae bacterium]|nr:methionine adenosyltransferase [Muribaculaceae bacterium]
MNNQNYLLSQKNYLFTSESVSEGHPDKVADQISDAILDEFLAHDPHSKVACETLVTTGQVVVAGEVKSNAYIDLMDVTRRVINGIGYNKSEYKFDAEACGVFSALHEQSADINRGVDRETKEEQGAGDQGMMFGYACNETENLMPLPLDLSHALLRELSEIRRNLSGMTYTNASGETVSYLRPDSKSQVTIEYDAENHPVRVHTIVISTQHDDFIAAENGKTQEQADKEMLDIIRRDVENVLIPRVKAAQPQHIQELFNDIYTIH